MILLKILSVKRENHFMSISLGFMTEKISFLFQFFPSLNCPSSIFISTKQIPPEIVFDSGLKLKNM